MSGVPPPVPLSRLVAATPGDGVLTVQSGQFVVAEYADVKTATTAVRAARTTVDCQAKIDVFRVDQLGPDLPFTLGGGCDGDGYLDAQESFTILYQYMNRVEVTLYDAKVSFAVKDPVTGNPVPWVTVVDPQKDIGTLFFGNTQVSSFAFRVTGVPPGRQKVRLEVCISSSHSGQDTWACSTRRAASTPRPAPAT